MTATVEPGETVDPGDRTARVVVVRRLPGFDPTAPVIPAPRRPTDTEPPGTRSPSVQPSAPAEPTATPPATTPDATTPDARTPDPTTPDARTPGAAKSGATRPGAAESDAGSPEAATFPDSGGVDPAYVRLVLRLVLEVLHRRRPPAHLAGALGVRARRYVASMTGRLGEHPGAGPGRRRVGSPPPGITPLGGGPPGSRPLGGGPPGSRPLGSGPPGSRPPGSTSLGSTSPGGRPVRGRLGGGLHSVRICSPADGIAEVGAVWADRNRYRALAARFERDHPTPTGPPRWYCTEIRLG